MNASHPKIIKLHADTDARFKELNFEQMKDFPDYGYDRFFLYRGVLIIVDHPDGARTTTVVRTPKLSKFMRRLSA